MALQGTRGGPAHNHHLTFGKVESKAELTTGSLDPCESQADSMHAPSQNTIVQVKQRQIQGAASHLISKRLQRRGKQERPQGVALLHTSAGPQGKITKLQPAFRAIAPSRPPG